MSGQLRGPPAQSGFGSRITLPLAFPRRHPPESRERRPQVPGRDRGLHDQRRAARGPGSRDRLTQPRAVSGSPGFGRRGPRPPAAREAEEREGRSSGSQAAGRPGRPARIPLQGARTHLARVSLHGTRTVPASSREFPPPPQRASSPHGRRVPAPAAHGGARGRGRARSDVSQGQSGAGSGSWAEAGTSGGCARARKRAGVAIREPRAWALRRRSGSGELDRQQSPGSFGNFKRGG